MFHVTFKINIIAVAIFRFDFLPATICVTRKLKCLKKKKKQENGIHYGIIGQANALVPI